MDDVAVRQARPALDPAAGVAPVDRPGLGRVRLGATLIFFEGAMTAWSLLLVAAGIHALDFSWFMVRVASHPGPFVMNDVSLPLPIAFLVVLPVAVFGVVAALRSDNGRQTRTIVIAAVLWVALGAAIVVAGGDRLLLLGQLVVLAPIGSGAWAGRRPASRGRRLATESVQH
jgi:hypothetical protein